MLVVDVDLDLLDGLQPLARLGVLAEDNARPADRELEALAAHLLDQHAQPQLAPARDLEGIPALALAHLDRDIAFRLAEKPSADHAARHLVAFAARQRRIV